MTPQSPIKVLVVDDSGVFRRFLVRALMADPAIAIIGEAASAAEAEVFLRHSRPDVITLDLEMPGKSGLDFLRDTAAPMGIATIVISATTPRGAARSIEALSSGAVEVIAKPRGSRPGTADHLALDAIAARVKVAAMAHFPAPVAPSQAAPLPPARHGLAADWPILLGASTGGVQALGVVLQALPRDCPPVLIVQHMPEGFTGAFAQRLDTLCAIHVREAQSGDRLRPGQALIAPGGARHMVVARHADQGLIVDLVAGDPVCFSRPAVDVLFLSAAKVLGARCSAAVLTGMGSDGALGLLALARVGAQTFAQDEATSLIYGMPARAFECGAARAQLPLDQMASRLLASVGTASAAAPQTFSQPALTGRRFATPQEF
jgi:two-component system chemotaxis response regulator CheB